MLRPIDCTLCCLLLVALNVVSAYAAPYVPADGAQVIERLPDPASPAQRELKRLRAALAAAPQDVRLASELARRDIGQARASGDPRYLGYAQAALAPWWRMPHAPAEVMVLRATLLQSLHRFPEALRDLDAVLRNDRGNAQAWLTRATILTVQGKYSQARASCERLFPLVPQLATQACLANVAGVSGDAAGAYQRLQQALERDPQAEPALQLWAHTLLAEIAARRGDALAAERAFRHALAIDNSDSYLLGAYADFLLDRKRPAEAAALLKDGARNDGLLLRHALALQALGAPAAKEEIGILRERFEAAVLRGDGVHRREQARFALWLQRDPRAALNLAQENWQVQKEPADLRILLEAASAAHDREARRAAADWLNASGLQDRALSALAQGG